MVVGFIVSLFPSMSLIINSTDEGRGGRGLGSCVTKGPFNGLLIPLVSGSLLLSLTLSWVPSRLIPWIRIFPRPVSPVVVGVASFSPPLWSVPLPGFSWPCVSPPLVSRVGVKKPVIPVVVRVGVETGLVPPILILRGVPRIQGGSVGLSLVSRPEPREEGLIDFVPFMGSTDSGVMPKAGWANRILNPVSGIKGASIRKMS
jgi:hypothetical protein